MFLHESMTCVKTLSSLQLLNCQKKSHLIKYYGDATSRSFIVRRYYTRFFIVAYIHEQTTCVKLNDTNAEFFSMFQLFINFVGNSKQISVHLFSNFTYTIIRVPSGFSLFEIDVFE